MPVTITVTALGSSNQPDPLFQDSLHCVTSDPQVAPFDLVFSGNNGTASFTIVLKTAGSQTITLTDPSRPAIMGATVTAIQTAAVSTLGVTGFPSPTLTGAVHGFTVTALDAFGNQVNAYRGTVQLRVMVGMQSVPATLPNAYTFTAADQGAHVFSASLNTVGISSLTATDTANTNIVGKQQVDVANLTSSISGPGGVGVRGQPLNFTLTATEDGVPANSTCTYRIDWDGNGTVDQVVSGAGPTLVSHVYPANGMYTLNVTVVDGAGNVSPQPAVQTIAIQSLALEPDLADSTKTALVIGGTPGDDIISISPADVSGQTVTVSINGAAATGPYAPSGHILVYGQSGNDTIQEVAATINNQTVMISVPALLFGGSGRTTLSAAGSGASNVLVGGSGDSNLIGGRGRDILIGGAGANALHAGSGDDVLIGGSTAFDTNLPALLALMAEWSRTDLDYAGRVQDLFGVGRIANPSPSGNGGLNGSFLLNHETVNRDAAADQFFGGSGQDWFWFSAAAMTLDKINNYAAGETVTFE
jgi:Ca2+-binding RTX toxin-like protein